VAPAIASWISVALGVLPSAVLVVLRARRDREPWEIALDLPLGVALDLLSLLVVSRFVSLEVAALGTRAAWIAVALADLARRRTTRRPMPAWPRCIGRRELLLVAGAVAFAVVLSTGISRACLNSDRRWHIPLVGSLRGQSAPFHNVYDPTGPLAYHYAGDVFAAELVALSGAVLHASFALSIAHDVLFGLTAATLALLFSARRAQATRARDTLIALGSAVGFLLAGPSTLLRGEPGKIFGEAGYAWVSFLRLSFRPNIAYAGLLAAGLLGAVVARLGAARSSAATAPIPASRTWPVLVACTAALSVADEPAIGTLGFALGVAWLVAPEVLHPRRAGGLVILLAMAAALVVPTLVAGGSFAPGAPRQPIQITEWRLAGYHNAPLPLSTLQGVQILLDDALPFSLAGGAALWTAARLRRRRATGPRVRALIALFGALVAVSFLALTKVQVSDEPEEGHRFLTGLMFATPIVAAGVLSRARGVVGSGLALAALALPAASTLYWRLAVQPEHYCDGQSNLGGERFDGIDCRARMGARRGERATPEYVSAALAYTYDGCHPVYAPSSKQQGQHWALQTGAPVTGRAAVALLHGSMLRADEPLRVTCAPRETRDFVCMFARGRRRCSPRGDLLLTCELSAADRAALLRDPRLE
jgi:hypothetical protein